LKNIVVFSSGSGSNFQSIINAISTGVLDATITGLITDRENIRAIERANNNNIPYSIVSPKNFDSKNEYELKLLKIINFYHANILVLAGYLKKIPSSVIDVFRNRILNIHPSLLPKYGGKGFYGIKVHQAVIQNGELESGCTVHLVNEIYDDGPILGQIKVPINSNDTPSDLAQKILAEEHRLYPQIISEFLKTLS
jgi:formyltetrahydrofolate-dependent phosphoribosylglycinamide formyltransferase